MPTVNIFYKNSDYERLLESLINNLKDFIAQQLNCSEIKLNPKEISIRLIKITGNGMIGNIELEITAYSFPERVKKQDEICLNVMNYIQRNYPNLKEIKVWLKLCELGHSW